MKKHLTAAVLKERFGYDKNGKLYNRTGNILVSCPPRSILLTFDGRGYTRQHVEDFLRQEARAQHEATLCARRIGVEPIHKLLAQLGAQKVALLPYHHLQSFRSKLPTLTPNDDAKVLDLLKKVTTFAEERLVANNMAVIGGLKSGAVSIDDALGYAQSVLNNTTAHLAEFDAVCEKAVSRTLARYQRDLITTEHLAELVAAEVSLEPSAMCLDSILESAGWCEIADGLFGRGDLVDTLCCPEEEEEEGEPIDSALEGF